MSAAGSWIDFASVVWQCAYIESSVAFTVVEIRSLVGLVLRDSKHSKHGDLFDARLCPAPLVGFFSFA